MSANFFGNLSQGYFGFYFGPNEGSGVDSVYESLTVADSSSALVAYVVSRDESLTISDGISSVLAVLVEISESLSASDASSVVSALVGELAESLYVTDVESVQTDFLGILDESVALSDTEEATVSGTSVLEILAAQDLSDSVLTPNPTPTPDNSATTMAPSAGVTIDKKKLSEARTRPRAIRRDYDGEVKIKLFPEVKPIVVQTARAKGLAQSSSKASGFQPIITFRASAKSLGKTMEASRIKSVVGRRSSGVGLVKAYSSAKGVTLKFAKVSGKSKPYGIASGFSTQMRGAYSMSKSMGAAGGFAQSFVAVKKSKSRAHSYSSGSQTTEFTQDQMELIFAMAEREFFR